MGSFVAKLLLALAAFLLTVSGQDDKNVAITRSAPTPPARQSTSTQCSPDRRTDPKAGVLISEVILEGATVSSSELMTIKGRITGACFDEDTDLIGQVVRSAFSDQGFAQADVKNVTLEANDSLAVPKPVTLKAEVAEGQRFRVGVIKFVGNHAFSNAKLCAAFPIKKGSTFQKSKIATGLQGVRKLYLRRGYADLFFIPDIMFTSTGMTDLSVDVHEGTQYHMGELKVYAKKEIADRMALGWHLREGAVFDLDYPQAYIDKSREIPSGFNRQNIRLVRNCPEGSITVMLIADQTDSGLQNPPKEVPCEKSKENYE